MMDEAKLLADQLKGLRISVDTMPEDAHLKPACRSFLEDGVEALAELQKAHPQARKQAERLALYFSNLATCLAGHYSIQAQALQEEKRRRAHTTNSKARLVADVACAIADDIWESDKVNLQQYRITETAKIVRDELARLGFVRAGKDGKNRPHTLRAVKEWITEVAPPHARAHGAEKAARE